MVRIEEMEDTLEDFFKDKKLKDLGDKGELYVMDYEKERLQKNNKKELILWGNGLAKREVIYVNDLADACISASQKCFSSDYNVGASHYGSMRKNLENLINNVAVDTGRYKFFYINY